MTDQTVTNDNLIAAPEEPAEDTWQTRYLSDDLKENATLQKFKDVEGLGTSYLAMQEMIGSRAKIPTDESSEEEVSEFYNKLGRPETPDKYEIDIPGGVGTDDEINHFFSAAHKSGLTNRQAQDALNYFHTMNENYKVDMDATMQKARTDAETTLKKEWGPGQYDKNLAVSRRAFNRFADDGLRRIVDESGMSNNVSMIKFLHKIGVAFSDPNMGGTGRDSSSLDSDSAKLEIDAIMKDKKHKYHAALFDNSDPKHAEAITYRDSLYDAVYQEEE